MSYPHEIFNDPNPCHHSTRSLNGQCSIDGHVCPCLAQWQSSPPDPMIAGTSYQYSTGEQHHGALLQDQWDTSTQLALLGSVPESNLLPSEQWWLPLPETNMPLMNAEMHPSRFHELSQGTFLPVETPLPPRGRARAPLVYEENDGYCDQENHQESRRTRLYRRKNTASSSSRAHSDRLHSARTRTPRTMPSVSNRYVQRRLHC